MTLAGKAKEEQGRWFEGTYHSAYILADGLINGYPHWLKTDGSQAIWFDKVNSNWKIGTKDNLGSITGFIAGPNGKDTYPNQIKQGWQYADNGVFVDAGSNDVIFKSIG